MAKSKQGFNASNSKDHTTVRSALTNVIGMTVLIGLATFAKLNTEYNFLDNMFSAQNNNN